MLEDDLLWQHLKSVPAFRALLRSVEARLLQQIELPSPVLDIGCGDGHFARTAFRGKLAAGIDPWWRPLSKASRFHSHKSLIQGFGNELPFADGSFATVLSNSVLEHIPDLSPVLDDIHRVLKKNGLFVFTTPSNYFTELLAGAKWFESHGSSSLADLYRDFFNWISRHHHTDTSERWFDRLGKSGFTVEQWQYYFSEEALRALEIGHLQGMPSAMVHAITGHWIVAPWRRNLGPTERWLRPLFEEDYPEIGTMMLFVARKRS